MSWRGGRAAAKLAGAWRPDGAPDALAVPSAPPHTHTVEQHDAHLLDAAERAFIQAYKALPLPSQALFLRLFQRKGPLFRVAALSYSGGQRRCAGAAEHALSYWILKKGSLKKKMCAPLPRACGAEVPDAAAAASQLADAGLAALVAPPCMGVGWQQLADLLTVPELARVAVLGGGRGHRQANRPQLLGALQQWASSSGQEVERAMLAATGPVLRLQTAAVATVERLQRLFFLNEGQSLSQVRFRSCCSTLGPGKLDSHG